MTSLTSSTSGFEMCHILSLSVLRTKELETVAAFVKLLSDGLDGSPEMSGHSPYMVVGGLRFITCKKVIPVVELFCVFNHCYQSGTCKPVPSEEDRGYYNFVRNCGQYKFRPATYRKSADKVMIAQLNKLIKHERRSLPPEISEIGIAEMPTSLVVVFHFRGGSTSLAVALTPAIAGTELPEGTNNDLNELFLQEWEDGGPGSRWFLVPPPVNVKLSPYSWELVFPSMYDLILELKGLISASLLMSYAAEVRQWSKMGLQVPHSAIWATVMSMENDQLQVLSQVSLRDQLRVLLERLSEAVKNEELFDFAVPNRNYLDAMTKAQRPRILRDLQKGIEQLTSVNHFLDSFVGQRFPLPLPKGRNSPNRATQRGEEHRGSDGDNDTEMSTDTDYFATSAKTKDATTMKGCKSDCPSNCLRVVESTLTTHNSAEEVVFQKDGTASSDSVTNLVTLIIMFVVAIACLGILLSNYTAKSPIATRASSNTSCESDVSEESECDDADDSPRFNIHRKRV